MADGEESKPVKRKSPINLLAKRFAELKTLDGKTYKNVSITRVRTKERKVILKMKNGVAEVAFDKLPRKLQREYGISKLLAESKRKGLGNK